MESRFSTRILLESIADLKISLFCLNQKYSTQVFLRA